MSGLQDYLGVMFTAAATPKPGDHIVRALTGGWTTINPGARNIYTQNHTFQLADQDYICESNSTNGLTFTIDTNTNVGFVVGAEIHLARYGPGGLVIATAAGVSLRSKNGATTVTPQYGVAHLVQRQIDEWWLYGDIA